MTMAVATSLITTNMFAARVLRSPQTIRILHCKNGEAFGIKPIKVGRLLLWPADQVDALLSGNAKTTNNHTK